MTRSLFLDSDMLLEMHHGMQNKEIKGDVLFSSNFENKSMTSYWEGRGQGMKLDELQQFKRRDAVHALKG